MDDLILPRTTWLLHFTNHPDEIAEHGFIGASDANTAFLAGAANAEYSHKYGRHAVMFQYSGALSDHYGDQESQVIFRGDDVDPRDIVILYNREDGWIVKARRPTKRYYTQDTETLYAPRATDRVSDFERCQAWVMAYFAQYQHYLTAR